MSSYLKWAQVLVMLSKASSLDELKYPHAFIGGFAWSLLGSRRPTQILTLSYCFSIIEDLFIYLLQHDVDVLIQPVPGQPPIQSLVDELAERNRHFAKANIKFYFVQVCRLHLVWTHAVNLIHLLVQLSGT